MIISDAGDADLITVLSRLSSCYTKSAGVLSRVPILPLTLPSNELAVSSALGNSSE